ncbi:Uma2 family endonuclease [uncultured Enterovirga sp.]|uniref:Uma2 family endonuclease n=1 Tax=uncultured Enterovirga sp. TaxID=2026352 RepID=UPI0035CAEFF7
MSAQLNTTNEAEGLPRRRFTVQEVEWMSHIGLLGREERIELIGGEIVPMSPKGSFHERMKSALTIYWAQRLPPGLVFVTETTFRLAPDTYLEPDIIFYPESVGWNGLASGTAQLVVEIADTSLAYDQGLKARLYAGFGIVELWVVNAVTRETRIHRDPAPSGYRDVQDRDGGVRLVPVRAPDLAVTLSELTLH